MTKYEELRCMLEKNKKIPYPIIPKLYPNKRYCNLIYDSLGGKKGELTAITQYIYEHNNLQNEKEINHILKDIAIEEMHHLNILGNIIVNLGEKPIYKNSNGKLWTTENVSYTTLKLKEIININIELEEESISRYQKILKYTNNIYLRRIYERIILDETTHLEIFKSILFDLK